MLKPYYSNEYRLECGLDEAGRGCLAGSVFAAAVILPEEFRNGGIPEWALQLNDSKQLSDKRRQELRTIIEKNALAFAVCEVTNTEIDDTNILVASIEAMNRAVKCLKTRPDFLIVDGNRFRSDVGIPYKTVIKGDATYMSVAAASILAKTYRDEAMIMLDKTYPQYQWKKNKGYPTKAHRQAIEEFGITPLHRKTFNLLGEPTLF